MGCKGVCNRYKAKRVVGESRYGQGQKRCTTCQEYIIWEGVYCPCCNYRLRVKPRFMKYKKLLVEVKK